MKIGSKEIANIVRGVAVCCLLSGVTACLQDTSMADSDTQFDVGFIDTFKEGFGGWQAGIAEIPVDTLDDIFFEFKRDVIEEIENRDNNSIRVTASNPHSDAFVYITKQLDSLLPNTTYSIDFDIELKVSLEEDTSGTFDSKMYFKAGASDIKPDTMFVEPGSYVDYEGYILNLDKGNNLEDGSDIKTLAKVNVPSSKEDAYVATASGAGLNLNVTTDSDGKCWMLFGVDSELPFKMSYYFNTINIFLKEQ